MTNQLLQNKKKIQQTHGKVTSKLHNSKAALITSKIQFGSAKSNNIHGKIGRERPNAAETDYYLKGIMLGNDVRICEMCVNLNPDL